MYIYIHIICIYTQTKHIHLVDGGDVGAALLERGASPLHTRALQHLRGELQPRGHEQVGGDMYVYIYIYIYT